MRKWSDGTQLIWLDFHNQSQGTRCYPQIHLQLTNQEELCPTSPHRGSKRCQGRERAWALAEVYPPRPPGPVIGHLLCPTDHLPKAHLPPDLSTQQGWHSHSPRCLAAEARMLLTCEICPWCDLVCENLHGNNKEAATIQPNGVVGEDRNQSEWMESLTSRSE